MSKKTVLVTGLAAMLCCAAALGIDFSNRAYECPTSSTVFVSAFQRFASLKNSDSTHTRYNPTAGAVGYIHRQGMWEAGAAVSYEHGTRKYDESNGSYRVRSNTPGVSLFGTVNAMNGWYVDASTFLGFGHYKPKDLSGFGGGDSLNKTVFALGGEVGKNFELGSGFLVTPHVGVDYAYTPTERHRWAGARRDVDSQSYWEIPLGVSFSKTLNCGAWVVTPKVDLTLVNSIGGMDTINRQPGFAYRTNKGWRVAGIGGDHIGGRFTGGVAAKLNQRTEVGLDYTYEVRKSYNDHRLMAAFGWSF